MFVDDTLFLVKGDHQFVRTKCILWSGQEINYHKSSSFSGKHVHQSYKQNHHYWRGIKNIISKKLYLGYPIFWDKVNRTHPQVLLGIINSKLSSWKCSSLSQVGITIIDKHVLDSIPQYILQEALFPKSKLAFINKSKETSCGSTKTIGIASVFGGKWKFFQNPKHFWWTRYIEPSNHEPSFHHEVRHETFESI